MKKRLPLLRQCGDCEACCKVLSVKEIGKPELVRCAHQRSPEPRAPSPDSVQGSGLGASGCSIYKSRPTGCRTFQCLWLAEADPRLQKYARHRKAPRIFRASDRPDLSGILLHAPAEGGLAPIAREVWPGAADAPEGAALLERVTERRAFVLVRGERRTLFGPDEQVAEILKTLGMEKP